MCPVMSAYYCNMDMRDLPDIYIYKMYKKFEFEKGSRDRNKK